MSAVCGLTLNARWDAGYRQAPSAMLSFLTNRTLMTIRALPRELVAQLIRDLKRRGVDYADVRAESLLHESLVAEEGRVSSISLFESAGVGIRVLLNGSWGFASTPHVTRQNLTKTLAHAIELAKACALINKQPRPLAPVKPAKARHTSHYDIDPFDVPLSKKLDYLLWANTTLLGPDTIKRATTHMDFFKRHKLFCSTEGARIEQTLIESGAGLEVVAQSGHEVQTRSSCPSVRSSGGAGSRARTRAELRRRQFSDA